MGKPLSTYLILNYLIRKQSFCIIGKVELISNETKVLAALSSLDIGVGITKCNPSISGQVVILLVNFRLELTQLWLTTSQIWMSVLTEGRPGRVGYSRLPLGHM
jgi:hypothetical protein